MDRKTGGIIATIATVILCGCPGLLSLCMGVALAIVGLSPDANIDMFGGIDPNMAIGFGLSGICAGIIFVAIPIVVGIVTLRKPKDTLTSPGGDMPSGL